jgi:hypothetical protein
VSPKQPSFFPEAIGTRYSRLISSEPNLRIGSHASELLTDMMAPVEAHAREISSIAMA